MREHIERVDALGTHSASTAARAPATQCGPAIRFLQCAVLVLRATRVHPCSACSVLAVALFFFCVRLLPALSICVFYLLCVWTLL